MNQSESTLTPTDMLASEVIRNEDGHAADTQRASLLPSEVAGRLPSSRAARGVTSSPVAYPQPGGASIYQWWGDGARGRRLTATMLAILQSRTGGREMHRNETHMNRGIGRIWLYWPALLATTILAVGGLILAMSDSGIGTNVSFMLRKLI